LKAASIVFTAVYEVHLISRVKIHHHWQSVKKRSSFIMSTRNQVGNAQEYNHHWNTRGTYTSKDTL